MNFLGWFDYLFLIILIFLNIKFWNKDLKFEKKGCLFILGIILIPCVIIPELSIFVDIQIMKLTNPIRVRNSDSFNFLYLYFKFPFYWALVVLQFAVFSITIWKKENKNS